ncbi:MAG TPA: TonB-dependent receptor, partial [Sphingobium sp.]
MPSKMRETAVVRALVSVTAFLSSGALHAATPETAPPVEGAADADSAHTSEGDIIVNGHQFRGVTTPLRLSVDPRSDTASVTALSGDDISRQTLGTNIDIFRSIPGVQVGDFGQVGIAQGVSLRGWAGANDSNAVAFYQDGVQRNEGSSTGANGYLDINPLIPEVIDQLTVVKGPFDTRYGGPFALAGSAILTSRDTIDNRILLSVGSYGQVRSVLTLGGSSGETTYYTAIQGLRDDGYQRNSDQKQVSSFSKITTPLGAGKLSFSLQTFNIKFGSPGYLDLADIKAGIISPRSDVSDTDGGKKNEYTGILSYKAGDDRQGVEATAFAIHEYRTRFGTFTPFPQSFTRN